jgi:hypothetical protein
VREHIPVADRGREGTPVNSKDIIVIVPPGTRVLYMHSDHTNGEVLVMNAALLMSAPIADPGPLGSIGSLTDVPIYDAEKYTPDE